MTLTVALGRQLDSSLIEADVQPTHVRLLIKGRLLQLALPAEVQPDACTAQRSRASGRLMLTMPKAACWGGAVLAPARAKTSTRAAQQRRPRTSKHLLHDPPLAPVWCCAEGEDMAGLPPLPC